MSTEIKEAMFFIWSIEHDGWWKPNRNGYTASWSTAGRYSKDDAFRISARANFSSLNEVPVPVEFFEYQCRCLDALKKVMP